MKKLIVSRHPAEVGFIREILPEFADAEAKAFATIEDVRGADVVGDLPPHLASRCARYRIIEFTGGLPRGSEYSVAEIKAARAYIVDYTIIPGATADVATRLADNGLDVFAVQAMFPHLE